MTIASDPRAASISIGENNIGRTPIEREMWAGSYCHRPVARATGEQRPLELRGGQPERASNSISPRFRLIDPRAALHVCASRARAIA